MTELEEGVLMAAAMLARIHDQPGMAADILHEFGLGNADCSAMDEFDKAPLRTLSGARRQVKLRGLRQKREQPNVAVKPRSQASA